jgi:DNA-binding NarL/FixJ family response regulator
VPRAGLDLTERERWLLRLLRSGLIDTSDLAHHTGLPAADVRATLASAADKLGAESPYAGTSAAHRMGDDNALDIVPNRTRLGA